MCVLKKNNKNICRKGGRFDKKWRDPLKYINIYI